MGRLRPRREGNKERPGEKAQERRPPSQSYQTSEVLPEQ
jgi:hypothetical protein